MPELKAWDCYLGGFDEPSVVHATTAGKARYRCLLSLLDSYPSATVKDIRVRRNKARDIPLPPPHWLLPELDEADRRIVLGAFGGGSHIPPSKWGYRDHFCTSPGCRRMLRLAWEMGLFRGPFGERGYGDTRPWVGAFYYLTDLGKSVARSLIACEIAGGVR